MARFMHETGRKQRYSGTHRLDLFTAGEKLALHYKNGDESLTNM
jgi:hypothetical protein